MMLLGLPYCGPLMLRRATRRRLSANAASSKPWQFFGAADLGACAIWADCQFHTVTILLNGTPFRWR
jgi:hypothetical protein